MYAVYISGFATVYDVFAGDLSEPESDIFAFLFITQMPCLLQISLSAVLDTVYGRIRSCWKYTENGIRYEIETPTETEIIIGGVSRKVTKGKYILGEIKDEK